MTWESLSEWVWVYVCVRVYIGNTEVFSDVDFFFPNKSSFSRRKGQVSETKMKNMF